ncbi:hypothetical protein DAPPUDRAFT_312434 [Daphnia pulex]|uniref:Uncharacterized protein n=1 Tax=Daphnia pulex TaxID=6669 RepID=E9G0U6_DAPPU|nr:hypothetical protein DAPPUDRAFT_312434 [Daphnia pulex]|eukprot:EFX86967.1 hypothetical protein DAPPUDRAFT_312434 [Daphnia pulex]
MTAIDVKSGNGLKMVIGLLYVTPSSAKNKYAFYRSELVWLLSSLARKRKLESSVQNCKKPKHSM